MPIYGFDELDPDKLKHPFDTLAKTPEEWGEIFSKSLESIRTFLAIHDSFEVLAKCVNHVMASAASKKENPRWVLEKYEPYKRFDIQFANSDGSGLSSEGHRAVAQCDE